MALLESYIAQPPPLIGLEMGYVFRWTTLVVACYLDNGEVGDTCIQRQQAQADKLRREIEASCGGCRKQTLRGRKTLA